MAELDKEIGNLAAHFLAGTVNPTLAGMLADREAEKDRLVRQLAARPATERSVVPHPTLVRRYEKVGRLREALNDENVRADAMTALRSLIGSVTVHMDDEGGTVLGVEASTATLIDFAETKESPRPGSGATSTELAVVR